MRFSSCDPSARDAWPWSWAVVSLGVATGAFLVACGGGDLALPDGGPFSIRVVDGDSQQGPVGQPLGTPVTVEVTDAQDHLVEGATVQFALTSAAAGAEIAPPTTTTDGGGRAQAHVLLGGEAGLLTGEARVMVDGAVSARTSFSALAVSNSPANQSPRADFESDCEELTCQFTDASTDQDGSVTGWAWQFGDGDSTAEREPAHAYAAAGTYTVTLTVTDDDGSSDQSSTQVTVTASPPPQFNHAPQAEFEVSCQELRCAFTDRSTDDDGSVVSWQWDFGDGGTSTDRNPSHAYGAAGQYQVRLTARDDDGASDSRTHTAQPTAPPSPPSPPPPPPPANKPPSADFEVHCSSLTCSFADRSRDDDGQVVTWRWEFGDGGTSSERNPSHAYASPGRYQVLLTITDDDGAADSKTRTAEPAAPPSPPPPPPAPENKPPSADFEVHCEHLTCTFTDKSKDEDGSIVAWQWSFGDGTSSSQQNPAHPYATRGKYRVSLTVTDDRGATDTKERDADAKD